MTTVRVLGACPNCEHKSPTMHSINPNRAHMVFCSICGWNGFGEHRARIRLESRVNHGLEQSPHSRHKNAPKCTECGHRGISLKRKNPSCDACGWNSSGESTNVHLKRNAEMLGIRTQRDLDKLLSFDQLDYCVLPMSFLEGDY